MTSSRLSDRSLCRALTLLIGIALLAAACSGGDDAVDDAFASAVEAAEQQNNDAASDIAAPDEESPQPDGYESDEDRYQHLLQNSDRFAQTGVGAGRLVLGVDCLGGVEIPTAIITILGSDLPPGIHEFDVTPGGGSRLAVQETQVQDLPAGSTFYAAQRGFDAPEYTFTFETFEGATLTVTGC